MMRFNGPRICAAIAVVWTLGTTGSAAQEIAAPILLKSADEAAASVAPTRTESTQSLTAPAEERRPGSLIPLYASFATLQVFDARSTLDAVARGGVEANPIMKGFADNPAALIAVKAAGTSGVIFVTEKMWKRNRTAAIVFMVAANSAMAWVVSNNYRAAR